MPFIANQGDFLNQYGINIGNAYWQGAGNYDPTFADDGSGISGFNYGAAQAPTYNSASTSQDWQNLFSKGGSWGGQDWAKLGDQFAQYDAANGGNLLGSFGEYQRQYMDPNTQGLLWNPNFANRSSYDQSNVYGQLAGWLDQSGMGSQLGVNTGDLWSKASQFGTANAEDHRIADQSGGIFGKEGIPLPVLIGMGLVGGIGLAGGLAAGAGTAAAATGAGEAAAGTGIGSAIDMGGSGLTMADWGLGGSGATGFGSGTVGGGGIGAFGTNLGAAGTGLGAFGGGEAIAGPGWADAGMSASGVPNTPNGLSDLIKQVQAAQGNMPPGTTTAIQKLLGGVMGGGGAPGTTSAQNGTSGTAGGGTGGMGDITNLINSVLGYNQSNENNQFLKDMLSKGTAMADPFQGNRAEAGNMLMQSYRDPLSIFNGPAYQALDKRMQDTQLARDAASGNVFNAPERLAQRQAGFLDYLPKYQQNLMGMSGANANPAAPASFMATMAKPISDAGAKSNAILGSGVSSAGNILSSVLGGGSGGGAGGTNPGILAAITKMFGGGGSTGEVSGIPTNVSGAANGSTFDNMFSGGFWNSAPAAADTSWASSIPWDL